MKKIIQFLSDHWKVISASIGTILAALAVLFGLSYCGSIVRATIKTPKDSTANSITISTNNPVSVSPSTETSPTITITPNKK